MASEPTTALLRVFYQGDPSQRMDDAIAGVIGSQPVGGGYGVLDGQRDLDFHFATLDVAEWVARKVQHAFPSLTVQSRPLSPGAPEP